MSRSTGPGLPSNGRTHKFPFRSRTAPLESASNSSSGSKEPSKPRKLNSLLWFSREPDHRNTSDYNQQSQPSIPSHDRYGPGSNLSSRADINEDNYDDDDDDSDNGTVLPGQGHYTLRVINPDPVESSSSSSESEDEGEQQDNKQADNRQKQENGGETLKLQVEEERCLSKDKNPMLTVTDHGHLGPVAAANSNVSFVSSFLSTEISPTASSLSLGTTNSNVGTSLPSSSGGAQVELVRRQSKIELQENNADWLPPLDLTPLDWTIPVQGATAPLAPPPPPPPPPVTNRAVLGPVASQQEAVTMVASPLTLTPVTESAPEDRSSRASAGSASRHHHHRVLSPAAPPSIVNSGIVPSSLYGNRSVASTAKQSILTSTLAQSAEYSKYWKASHSLTNDPRALKMYRQMAEKTNLQDSQLAYAKYLLEIAEYYDKGNNKTQQLLQQQHRHARSQSSSSTAAGSLDVKRGRASLQLLPLRHLRIGSEGDDDSGRKKRALQEEGIRWIKRLAKQGYGEAAYLLATMYDQEKYGLRRQPLKSFKLYEIAACAAKMPEALHGIATFHESQGNASEAVAYYKAAAEQGLVDSVHRMALIYLHGELGQRQNMTAGLDVLAQAAENATEACPEPLFTFGQVLANIYPRADIPSELVQTYGGAPACVKCFERAAEYGHIEAQSQIGFIYEYGLYGAPVDLKTSFKWYEKAAAAAEWKDARAMLGLSRLYNGGTHYPDDSSEQDRLARDVSGWTERNEDLAFSWCDKAAEQEDEEALFVLGRFYEYGFGTPRDLAKAQGYYRQAALKGNKDAIELLKRNNNFNARSIQQQQQKDGATSRRDSSSTCVVM